MEKVKYCLSNKIAYSCCDDQQCNHVKNNICIHPSCELCSKHDKCSKKYFEGFQLFQIQTYTPTAFDQLLQKTQQKTTMNETWQLYQKIFENKQLDSKTLSNLRNYLEQQEDLMFALIQLDLQIDNLKEQVFPSIKAIFYEYHIQKKEQYLENKPKKFSPELISLSGCTEDIQEQDGRYFLKPYIYQNQTINFMLGGNASSDNIRINICNELNRCLGHFFVGLKGKDQEAKDPQFLYVQAGTDLKFGFEFNADQHLVQAFADLVSNRTTVEIDNEILPEQEQKIKKVLGYSKWEWKSKEMKSFKRFIKIQICCLSKEILTRKVKFVIQ